MEWGENPLYQMDRVMCWNVRGLNQQGKQIMVKQFIDRQKVGLVALLETRIKPSKLGALYLSMFQNWCFSSNSLWHVGGAYNNGMES